jgi:hypothetical protein
LNETPLGGTLVVYQGTVVLPQPGYTISGKSITFPQPLSGITLSYQTSSYANSGLSTRQNFFAPYLYGVSFKRL